MKKLILILLIATTLFSFKGYTEYEAFIKGHPIEFHYQHTRGVVNYRFIRIEDFIVKLQIDNKDDGFFVLEETIHNKSIILKNNWEEFRFYFDEGTLEYIVQEVYKNEKYNIDNFTITFDL